MIQLALYKGKGLIGNALVHWWTGSIYSHCELVINGICYSSSAMDGGVRAKEINLANGNWDLLDLPWADETQALTFFETTKDCKYDWYGLFGSQIINFRSNIKDSYFCNEWVCAALGIPQAEIYNPQTFGNLCKFLTWFKS